MTEFHNPYHFVPATAEGSLEDRPIAPDASLSAPPDGPFAHQTHARYVAERPGDGGAAGPVYSGRILCRLTTETPLVIGARHDIGAPTVVHPYTLPGNAPAIPGSSLRGLISSVAEAASNSALRVLEDTAMQYRDRTGRHHLASLHAFFAAISADLLPFGPDRTEVTIAESMFGFVEDVGQQERVSDHPARVSASRVRVSNAGLGICEQEPPYLKNDRDERKGFVLQELSEPKAPCPALYFTPAGQRRPGGFIRKSELRPGRHAPQGRKFYLHDLRAAETARDGKYPWETRDEDPETFERKSQVRPLRVGLNFFFHVDFDNLSKRELGLLLYALRPTEAFRHKLGMGKPLGLGTVCIDPVALFLVDRLRRYQEVPDLFAAKRYQDCHLLRKFEPADWEKLTKQIPDKRYDREMEQLSAGGKDPAALAELLRKLVCDDPKGRTQRQALEQIGDPQSVQFPVHYPQIEGPQEGTAKFEQERFKWFVDNDKVHHELLPPLPTADGKLPKLQRRRPPPKQPRR